LNVHFATAADGTRLAWDAQGEGGPAVVLTDGIGCAGFIWREILPGLAARRRVIHWTYRGHGRSEVPRDLARTTLGDCADDLLAVMDAAGEREAVLVGHSMGVQVCLEAHRRAPERVRALGLLCGAPGRILDTWHGTTLMARAFPWLELAVLAAPGPARWIFRNVVPSGAAVELGMLLEVNRALLPRADLERYLRDVAEVSPEVFVRLLGSAAEADLSGHLPFVHVPALIVAGEKDTWTPVELSVRMHEALRGSELLVLPAATHCGVLEHAELVRPDGEEERVADHLPRVEHDGAAAPRLPAQPGQRREDVARVARKGPGILLDEPAAERDQRLAVALGRDPPHAG
jgi:pimeloyl-ACP methyl ester carboxylesterase